MATLPDQVEVSADPSFEDAYQAPAFSVEASAIDSGFPVVTICGEVDMATAPEISEVVTQILARSPRRLTFDLSDVTFLDSSGLKVLVYARRGLPHTCPVVLRQPQPIVRKVLEITGLDHVCIIED